MAEYNASLVRLEMLGGAPVDPPMLYCEYCLKRGRRLRACIACGNLYCEGCLDTYLHACYSAGWMRPDVRETRSLSVTNKAMIEDATSVMCKWSGLEHGKVSVIGIIRLQ
jgi:hypothetical protein